jgi:hypothetical protein
MEIKKSIKSTREIKNTNTEKNKLNRKIIELKGGSIINDFETFVKSQPILDKEIAFFIEYYKQNTSKIIQPYSRLLNMPEIKKSIKEEIDKDLNIVSQNLNKINTITPQPKLYNKIDRILKNQNIELTLQKNNPVLV